MYFFSNKYIQINNNTKTNINIFIGVTPRYFGLRPLVSIHLDIKPLILLSLSKLELPWFSFENRDR